MTKVDRGQGANQFKIQNSKFKIECPMPNSPCPRLESNQVD
ncbi:MAG: hypothetical protein ACRAVC_20115 [Trichormus sp.]